MQNDSFQSMNVIFLLQFNAAAGKDGWFVLKFQIFSITSHTAGYYSYFNFTGDH